MIKYYHRSFVYKLDYPFYKTTFLVIILGYPLVKSRMRSMLEMEPLGFYV